MSNVLLATPELSDNATITGTNALGDNSLVNLQRRSLSLIYRTSPVCEINIDFGVATEIDFVALIGHTGSGTVRIKAGATEDALDYDSGVLNLITGADVSYEKNIFASKFTAQTYQYFKLEIDDSANTYFQAGRIYLGKAFQPAINASFGLRDGFTDRSRINRSISGDAIPTYKKPLKTTEFEFQFLNEGEMYGTLYDIDRSRGKTGDILFIKDPDAIAHFQRNYVYGLMDDLPPIVSRFHNIYNKPYRITELP